MEKFTTATATRVRSLERKRASEGVDLKDRNEGEEFGHWILVDRDEYKGN